MPQLPLPRAFLEKRLHSLTGLFIVLYLIEHLLVNSQAALFVGADGSGFIKAVNSIQDLPYLPLIEIFLLGVPIALHTWWGVKYLQTSLPNDKATDGTTPDLKEYPRNRAYRWQRITSWILLFGIALHVIHMRFLDRPTFAKVGTKDSYFVLLSEDNGLEPLADRIGFELYTRETIPTKIAEMQKQDYEVQRNAQVKNWVKTFEKRALKKNQVIAVTNTFGAAELLAVRETFKSPLMIALYTIFVLAACFHAFNGFWTFLISWGITSTKKSEKRALYLAKALMVGVAFLGLATIFGTYWINLKN
jgi:succinate dehydrogenase / fumarate reductase cytochrome b subunit